jgi:hypothetical protein
VLASGTALQAAFTAFTTILEIVLKKPLLLPQKLDPHPKERDEEQQAPEDAKLVRLALDIGFS